MYSSTITQYEDRALPKKQSEEAAAEAALPTPLPDEEKAEPSIIWFNVFGLAALHIIALYGVLFRSHEVMLYTWLYSEFDFI